MNLCNRNKTGGKNYKQKEPSKGCKAKVTDRITPLGRWEQEQRLRKHPMIGQLRAPRLQHQGMDRDRCYRGRQASTRQKSHTFVASSGKSKNSPNKSPCFLSKKERKRGRGRFDREKEEEKEREEREQEGDTRTRKDLLALKG